MSCEKMSSQLELLLEGELSSQAEKDLRAHLSVCPDCASTLERLTREREDLVAALAPADLSEAKLKVLESGTFEAIAATEPVSSARPARPISVAALNIVVPLVASIVAAAVMVLVDWDTRTDKLRLANAIANSWEAVRMTMVVLVSVSATLLVVAASRLGSFWSRVTKGEF